MTLEEKKNNGFDEPFVVRDKNRLLLLGPCFYYPYLYIWDFINGDLIKKVETTSGISDMCLWNDTYVFVGLTKSDKNKIPRNGYVSGIFLAKDSNFNTMHPLLF